jgi:hypothetical protein
MSSTRTLAVRNIWQKPDPAIFKSGCGLIFCQCMIADDWLLQIFWIDCVGQIINTDCAVVYRVSLL